MSRKKAINIIIPEDFAGRGNRLKSWWKSKGWSKAEFARRMNIWPQNVNKYFAGELDPTNLAEQLMEEGCDVVWIIDGKTPPQPVKRGMVAETPVLYGRNKKDPSKEVNKRARERVLKLAKLLDADPEKADIEMLDLLIKSMEEKQKKKR